MKEYQVVLVTGEKFKIKADEVSWGGGFPTIFKKDGRVVFHTTIAKYWAETGAVEKDDG